VTGKQLSLFPKEEGEVPNDANTTVVTDLKPLLDEFTPADLPNEDMKLLASVMGFAQTVFLMKEFAGMQFFIPKRWMNKILGRLVKRDFNGSNAKILARKFNISERQVYNLYKEKEEKST
jgi:Mor family transcriptional regulator